ISGANPQRKPLDSWVLGTYLEEVIHAANIRFARISAGRYRFILKEDAGSRGYQGLELTIHDSHTGRERTTETLSGGEIFEASLSLALALTDVVQSRSGGIRLDSLFIDEGFGTLDGESLDNAIAVLDEVREHRMVGIISHVEALYGAIQSHVEIEKSNTVSKIVVR
ncbi:MAG: SbcC/MukB-like Walker B domain-containing protein, partial [Treponema sp.]